jgi:hypothetical protein
MAGQADMHGRDASGRAVATLEEEGASRLPP